mmetsp:Transcript_27215/g.82613  ORF Transcript_27215/g.82613 Transcript_27215/m.82613 type:complete len:271 (+) Transcript_27215:522-1334(+)
MLTPPSHENLWLCPPLADPVHDPGQAPWCLLKSSRKGVDRRACAAFHGLQAPREQTHRSSQQRTTPMHACSSLIRLVHHSRSSSSNAPLSSSSSNASSGIVYRRITGLLGSLSSRYRPSSSCRHKSTMDFSTPHALLELRLICRANSAGLYVWVPSTTWLELSLTWLRDTYPSLIMSAPASIDCNVHLASLQELFFSSVARTAPRCESNFCLQSRPFVNLASTSLRAYIRSSCSSFCLPCTTASSSVRMSILTRMSLSPSLGGLPTLKAR